MKTMRKWWLIVGVVLTTLFIWFLLTADCVINRANSGTPIDWANIKDCSY